MGGKSKLRKTIIEMISEHICYAEAFFGAGWVYFGKELSKAEVINLSSLTNNSSKHYQIFIGLIVLLFR
jgi:site-specific DNA-adenine methylase